MKLITKLTSAALITGIIAGSSISLPSADMSVDAATRNFRYDIAAAHFSQRVSEEKAKFPSGAYWNHEGLNSNKYDDETISYTPCDHLVENAKNALCCSQTMMASGVMGGQCTGFAYKLAKDIWGTDQFCTFYDIAQYEPKVGDNVRLEFPVYDSNGNKVNGKVQPHSIFITSVDKNGSVTFAECNRNLEDCQIFWDSKDYYTRVTAKKYTVRDYRGNSVSATEYVGDSKSLTKVDTAFLRKYAVNYERPALAGDLNMNGKIDGNDVLLFESSVMTDGRTIYPENPKFLNYYDVNGDGHVDTNDYNELRYGYGPDKLRIVYNNTDLTCRWNTLRNENGFLFSDGSYYVKNDLGGVAWIGSVDKEIESLYVSSKVYSSTDKCWYDVTEIGYNSYRNCHGEKTCTNGYKIKKLYIPDTVKCIHSYAFQDWTLEYLGFSGSSPQLDTIQNNAFDSCRRLKSLDLSSAKKLKNIGRYAFNECTALEHVYVSYKGINSFINAENGINFDISKDKYLTLDFKY